MTTRRSFIKRSILGLLAGTVSLNAKSQAIDKPNIILISTDEHYAGAMSCAGNINVSTPAIDSIAAAGVRFAKSYCAFPLCTPARAAVMTSRMPYELGVSGNDQGIPDNVETFGETFRNAGYQTFWTGKWHVPIESPEPGSNDVRGFDVLPYDDPFYNGNMAELDINSVKSTIKFLRGRPIEPFLLSISLNNPHDITHVTEETINKFGIPTNPVLLPHLTRNFYAPDLEFGQVNGSTTPPALNSNIGWSNLTFRRHSYQYYRFIEIVDSQIGKILEEIKLAGLEGNTYLVFTGDHGEMNGSHRRIRKLSMYDEALSVPFIIRGPGIPKGIVNRKHLISALDIYPTLCDAAGITPPHGLRGKSALKVLKNFNSPVRKYAFAQIGNYFSRVAISIHYKYALFLKAHTAYNVPVREAFFDMKHDPGETKNLINDIALKPIIDNHRKALNNWMIYTNDPFVTQAVVVD